MTKHNPRADKSIDQWSIAMYCDYGKKGIKRLIRASYSVESARSSWNKMYKAFSKNGYRCWQEDKSGKVIRDSINLKE